MRKSLFKKSISVVLTAVLALNIGSVTVPSSAEETTTVSATDKSDIDLLSDLIKANMPSNIDIEKYGEVLAAKSVYDTDNADLFLQREAFRVGLAEDDTRYKLFDIDGDGTNEMLVSYESGVRMGVSIYRYVTSQGKTKEPGAVKVRSFNAVSAVYCNKKKHYITVQQSEGAASGFYTAFKLKKNGKLKKIVKYSFDENKYKKNKKKITKKQFNKQLTTYCKNGEILIKKKAPKDSVDVTKLETVNYMSKDLYYNFSDYSTSGETTIMRKAGTGDKPPVIGDPAKANYEGSCRWLIENFALMPMESKRRFAVVRCADKLNVQAANSLLKLAEEPPNHGVILFLMEDGRFGGLVRECSPFRQCGTFGTSRTPENNIITEKFISTDVM